MSRPHVTVLLPVYHESAAVVKRAADSILCQTYDNLSTLVILDDPNNDALRSFLIAYCADKPSFDLRINERNMGLPTSLNNAIATLSTDLICRMDADDLSHPNRINEQVEYLVSNDLDLVGCFMRVVDDSGKFLYHATNFPVTPSYVKRALAYNNCVMHPTWLGKSDLFHELPYRTMPLSEDYDLLLRAASVGKRIGNCPKELLDYTLSAGSLSRSNLYRQYLYQVVLTSCYKKGLLATTTDAKSFVNARWSEGREKNYTTAYDMANQFLSSTKPSMQLRQLIPMVMALCRAPAFLDKTRRVIAVNRICRREQHDLS